MARPHLAPAIHPTDRLVGEAPAIAALRAQIRHLATFDTLGNPFAPSLLLQGETGTGKGLVARILHDSGPRVEGPFLEVNCAAIPETLLEAELFGFEAGAFTDARRAKAGLFEAASCGTLFLDEIDALPLALQSKLLTVVEAKRVRRLGAVVDHPMDVKLSVATQADLQAIIAAGQFRADLYHRLAVVLIEVPPLRERGADVVLLAQHYLQQCAEAHRLNPKRLSPGAEAWLQCYAWPGNVRELGHLMERVTLLSADAMVSPETLAHLCLPSPRPAALAAGRPDEEDAAVGDEAVQIRQALLRTAGNVARAARLLGMTRGALRHRLGRYGITPSRSENRIVAPTSPQNTAQDDRTMARSGDRRPVRLHGESQAPVPAWEQKPVAVLAMEVTWPEAPGQDGPGYERWTVAARWEKLISEKVQGFGGVVLQRLPLLLIVVFGIPQTQEQLPQRAVQTALTLRQVVAEAADRGPSPELRLAIHWGQVLVDTRAIDPRAWLLPVGDTLARPGRLLGYAAAGEIVASPEMGRLVGGWCDLRAPEALLGMGQPNRIDAYTVVGNKSLSSPLEMHRQRPLNRFVGRARELALLEDLLGQAMEGRGQVVGIVGEPGVGKSRLCYEFVRAHPTQEWQILETSADSYGQTISYLPVIEWLKSYFQIVNRDDVSMRRTKVVDKLRTLGQSIDSSLPAFLSLLDVPVEDATWQALDSPQRRQRMLDAIKRLLIRESQLQPILLVAENLHWIDGETQALLDNLVEGLPIARLLLLVTYRPEYQHVWTSKTYYTQLRVDPLPPGLAQELLSSLLGDDISLVPVMQSMLQRTEGNPFFLEESVQTLVETHVLVGARGAYRLATPLKNVQVPTTVQAVLVARIDRLPPQEKRLLQTAAVIGMEVPFALLQAVAELSEAELQHGLAHLQAAEFLYEARFFPDLAYTFKHAISREVAYGSLLHDQLRLLHARIVEAIERLYADHLTEQAERLAQHAFQGEVWDKAVAYGWQASTRAFTRSAQREVVVCSEQALAALKHLPKSRAMQEQAIDLRIDLRHALLVLGEFRQALDCLREAAILAEALDDQPRLGWISAYMCRHCREMGDHDGAVQSGQQALAVAASLGDFPLQVMARHFLGVAYHVLGDHRRAIGLLRSNVESLAGDQLRERFGGLPSVLSRAWLARCLAELGAFPEATAHGEEAVRIAEALDHPNSLIIAYLGVGFLSLRQRNLARAISVLERGLDLCRVWNILNWFPDTASALGCAYAFSGRIAEALSLLEQVEQTVGPVAAMGGNALQVGYVSEAYLLAGRLEEAVQRAGHALALARGHKERGYQAWALRLLGEIAAHQDPTEVEPAEHPFRQALSLAEELGMRPLMAHCHLGLGILYTKIGRTDQARVVLATATDLYRTMGMTFWLSQAEEVLVQAV